MTSREQLLDEVRTAPPEKLPEIYGDLQAASAEALARIATPKAVVMAEAPGPDQNVDIHRAAELTGMSESWLKKNAKILPFTVKTGSKRRLFSLRGIERWNESNRRRTRAGRT